MNKMHTITRRLRKLTIGSKSQLESRYFCDMTLDEFLEECQCIEYKDKLEAEGCKTVDDVNQYLQELLEACKLPAIPKARFREGAKELKDAIRKKRTRPTEAELLALAESQAADIDDALDDALTGVNGSTAAALSLSDHSDLASTTDIEYETPDTSNYVDPAGMDAPPPLAQRRTSTLSAPAADFGTPLPPQSFDVPATHDQPEHDYEDPDDAPVGADDLYEDPDSANDSNAPPVPRRTSPAVAPSVLPGVAMSVGNDTRTRPNSVLVVPSQAPLPSDATTWNNSEVIRWLKDQDLGDFKDVFYANGFEGKQLVTLTAGQFKSGGFPPERCDLLGAAILKLNSSRSGSQRSTASSEPARPSSQQSSRGSSGKESNAGGKKAKATFAYTATKESHLTIDEGEIVTVVNNEKSWWVVRNAAGQSGKVPSNYMELVGASDSSTTATSPASAGTSGMENMPWFHADINDRTVAEHRLSVCPNGCGTFLVRKSGSAENAFTLSVRGESSVIHLKIQNAGGRYSLGQDSNDTWPSIVELIQFHRTTHIRVAHREHLTLKFDCPK